MICDELVIGFYVLMVVTCFSTMVRALATAAAALSKPWKPEMGPAMAEPRERAARAKVVNCILAVEGC